MKKELLIAASAVAVAGVASNANAIDVELYGQVNKGVMISDDSNATEFNIVDNDFSSTRIGVKGEQALDNGLKASALLEMEMQDNASDVVAAPVATPTATPGTALSSRHARVGLGGDFGAIFVGHTSTATDGVTEQDLAGANDVLGSDINDIGGGITFVQTAGVAPATAPTIGNTTNNMDGNGRGNTVRYDSPIFNGFQVRTSASNGGDIDAGVFYHGRYDEFAIKAGIGHVAFNDNAGGIANPTQVESQTSGSISAKHDSGFGGTFAYGQQELEGSVAGTNDDPTFMYLKAGYTWDAFEVAADYAKHEAANGLTDNETTYYGLAGQYNLGNGVSAAAYYKNFEFDAPAVSYDDVSVYGVNMRVKF